MDEVSTATDPTSVKTTSVQRRSLVNDVGARLLRYRRWRGKPQRNRKLTSCKPRCRLSRNRSGTANSSTVPAIAVKEDVESKGREAAIETSP